MRPMGWGPCVEIMRAIYGSAPGGPNSSLRGRKQRRTSEILYSSAMSNHHEDPIVAVVHQWHQHMAGQLPGGLDALLDDECVFLSPIVFTPQRGKELTKLYLGAAGQVFPGDAASKETKKSSFHYVREVVQGHDAVLEFETMIDGTQVNGVDMIKCNDEGRIVEFKVMIRPLKAINLIHAQMKAMLEQMK